MSASSPSRSNPRNNHSNLTTHQPDPPDPPDRPTNMHDPKRCRLCDDHHMNGATQNELRAHFAARHPPHKVFKCPWPGCGMSTDEWSSLSRHHWRAKGHPRDEEQQKKVDAERKRDKGRGGRKTTRKKKVVSKRAAKVEREIGDNGEREREGLGPSLMRDHDREIAAFNSAQQAVQQSPQQQQLHHQHQPPAPQFSHFPLQQPLPPLQQLHQPPQHELMDMFWVQSQVRQHQHQHQHQRPQQFQFQRFHAVEPQYEPQHADEPLSQQHLYDMYPEFLPQEHRYAPLEVEQHVEPQPLGLQEQHPYYYQHLQYPQYAQQHQYYHSEVEQDVQSQHETQYSNEQQYIPYLQVQEQHQNTQADVEQDMEPQLEPQHDEDPQLQQQQQCDQPEVEQDGGKEPLAVQLKRTNYA